MSKTLIKRSDDLTADDVESFFKEAQSVGDGSKKTNVRPNNEDYYDLVDAEGILDKNVRVV